jgi:hypothetical protein
MLRLLSDEDVHGDIIRGLLRRLPGLDLVRVQDVNLQGSPDPVILEWAGRENLVLITEDVNTMVGFAHARVAAGEAMAGVLARRPNSPIGRVIDDIELVVQCYEEEDIRDQVVYVPLS